jgi:hypothetical protein
LVLGTDGIDRACIHSSISFGSVFLTLYGKLRRKPLRSQLWTSAQNYGTEGRTLTEERSHILRETSIQSLSVLDSETISATRSQCHSNSHEIRHPYGSEREFHVHIPRTPRLPTTPKRTSPTPRTLTKNKNIRYLVLGDTKLLTKPPADHIALCQI